ncbi:MAG: hypothetical protein EBX37_12205 [Alphaproteobacteria bacterium]|nr:hypothetical protein [Alphaproteobacteria bacterium]
MPFSEKYHITGTLPFVVLLSAMALCLLREGALEPMQARLFERSIFAFYGVMLFGTACLFDYSLYYRLDPARPLLADVTRAFPRPKADVLALLREAELPQGAALQLVYGPGELEDMYLREPATRPWVLPNTTVGFRAPLPSAMYERIARRRLRSAPREGWVLEAKEFPLEYVPPLAAAIGSAYQQVQVWEKGQWRLRRFERRP